MLDLLTVIITVTGASLVTLIGNAIMFKMQRRAKHEDEAAADERARHNTDEKICKIEKTMGSIVERISLLEAADLSILHDRLFYCCKQYIKRGYITVSDLETTEDLYNAYSRLGGNGTGTKLYLDVKQLPVKSD